MNTAQMIEQAIANRKNDYFMSSAGFDSKVGRVACFVDFRKSNPNSLGKHVAARFNLNGKVISRANLEKALAQ